MKTFIQLRDNVGFATLIVPDGEPDHTVTPDHTTAIEVFTDNPDQFLNQKYDEKTKSWSEAPILRYVVVDEKGSPLEIKRTYFEHELDGHAIYVDDLQPNWIWDGEKWNFPQLPKQELPQGVTVATPDSLTDPDYESEEKRLARVKEANKYQLG